MCSRVTLPVSLNSSIIFTYYFYRVSPIFLDQESICFGAPTSLSPTFVDNGKCVIRKTLTRWEVSARRDGSRISSSSFTFYDFITWYRAPLDGWFSTARIFLSSSLMMTSMVKKQLYNASSTIFRIEEASILFELPSKFFWNSYYSGSSPIFYSESHLRQDLEYRTITTIPLILPPMMKAFLLEE